MIIDNDDLGKGPEGLALEDGLYPAVCIGITVKEMANFDKTGVEDKIQFLFQIVNGQNFYVRSRPLKKSLNEKAGLWKVLQSWTKQKDAKTLIEKMGTGGQFDIRYFIGKPIQLTIKNKAVGDKEYPEIGDYMAPKKDQARDFIAEAIPAHLVRDVKQKYLIEGMSVKVVSPSAGVAPSDPACERTSGDAVLSDDLPFWSVDLIGPIYGLTPDRYRGIGYYKR